MDQHCRVFGDPEEEEPLKVRQGLCLRHANKFTFISHFSYVSLHTHNLS